MIEAKRYPYHGEMLTLREISERSGVELGTLRQRLNKKMPYEKAFSSGDLRVARLTAMTKVWVDYYGETLTITELAERTGMQRATLYNRYRFGDRGERIWRPLEHEGNREHWYDRI